MALRNNTWKINQWYDQSVAGNAGYAAFSMGGLWSWGDNEKGRLGQNNQVDYSSPKQVGSDTNWADIASTTGNNCAAIKSDGTLWVWGQNPGGVLGQNQASAQLAAVSSPVQVGSDTTWASKSDEEFGSDRSKFSTGGNILAIKTDGTLWGWGYNQYGLVANNTSTPTTYSSPVQIPGTTWKYVSSNGQCIHGIKTDGTLWGWGRTQYGWVGNNVHSDNINYSSPVQIPGTTWRTINLRNFNVLATKTDGTLWAWGVNVGGSLGQNNMISYSSPVQIPGTTWKQAVAGENDEAAGVKTDGTLWVWGYNENGLFGIPSIAADDKRSSPVQVPGTTWNNLEVFNGGMFATKTDGTLWSWGKNTAGQLGQNYITPGSNNGRSSPVQIPGTTWKRIAGTRNDFVYATKS